MTTPTPLAETIARLSRDREERRVLRDSYWGPEGTPSLVPGKERPTERSATILETDFDTLLDCARRCEAIETAGGLVAELRAAMAAKGAAVTAIMDLKELVVLLDAAADLDRLESWAEELRTEIHRLGAERDALAKRVEELETLAQARLISLRDLSVAKQERERELSAESARLRAENERLAETAKELLDIRERLQLKAEARAFVAEESLRAAQERVRELGVLVKETADLGETEVAKLLRIVAKVRSAAYANVSNEARLDLVCDALQKTWADRSGTYADTASTPGPITDPTQGVEHCLHVGSNRWDTDGPAPDCIPPGTPRDHCECLQSGLWAWVEEGTVQFEATESYAVSEENWRYDYEELPAKYRAHVERADFLAARALGVRVLGWAK